MQEREYLHAVVRMSGCIGVASDCQLSPSHPTPFPTVTRVPEGRRNCEDCQLVAVCVSWSCQPFG